MNSRSLLTSSALFLALVGLALTFAPAEVLGTTNEQYTVIGQLLGAALCGAACINWMARSAPMGGIYGRPLASGNLVHFLVGGLALVKVAPHLQPVWLFLPLVACYLLFAALFAYSAFFTASPSNTHG
ncbi:MAG: hypothetical protein JNL52_00915 [Flavobacteriales bacterium]|nr:hypothetical protein [Flavobacteriales bacterium]